MEYYYTLNTKAKKKFDNRVDIMVCSGWFGIYSEFNKYKKVRKDGKFTFYDNVDIKLSDDEIDFIVKNSKKEEY